MKYVLSMLAGVIAGFFLTIAALYFNPLAGRATLSPLVADEGRSLNLNYTLASANSVLVTNNGSRYTSTHPEKVAELWEPTVEHTQLRVTALQDSRGQPAGIGIKVSTPSEKTQLYRSNYLVDSAWLVYLPGTGVLGVYQQEDYWAYLRDVIVPAWRSSSDSWRGTWNRIMTVGPLALGTARAVGLSGTFDGVQGEAVESLNASAYSLHQGPVSMTSSLAISLHADQAEGTEGQTDSD